MIKFGVPKKERVVKREKYDFAVLTVMPRPVDKGKNYMFNLNKTALADLKIEGKDNLVAFSFDGPHSYIANVTTAGLPANLTSIVSLKGDFSNKEYHDFFCKAYGLNPELSHTFKMTYVAEQEAFELSYFVEETTTPVPEVVAQESV